MDYEAYRKAFFVDPPPKPKFAFNSLPGLALYFQEYEQAIAYYESVLGPPAYVEGENTKAWPIGLDWLTFFRGREDAPANPEVIIKMDSAQEAERLQAALVAAGGEGGGPFDDLMFEPLKFCIVKDPFGNTIVLVAPI